MLEPGPEHDALYWMNTDLLPTFKSSLGEGSCDPRFISDRFDISGDLFDENSRDRDCIRIQLVAECLGLAEPC